MDKEKAAVSKKRGYEYEKKEIVGVNLSFEWLSMAHFLGEHYNES